MADSRRALAAACVALILGTCHAGIGWSQEETEPSVAPAGPGDSVRLAIDLWLWGQSNEDPEAIAQAAKILANGPLIHEDEIRTAGEPIEGDQPAMTFITPQDILDEAVALATTQDNRKLARRLAAIELPGTRGTTHPGTLYCRASIPPGMTFTYRVEFEAVAPALAALANLGDGPLTLTVMDLHGNIVARTSRSSPDMTHWIPEVTAPFLIKIRNPGSIQGQYLLLSN